MTVQPGTIIKRARCDRPGYDILILKEAKNPEVGVFSMEPCQITTGNFKFTVTLGRALASIIIPVEPLLYHLKEASNRITAVQYDSQAYRAIVVHAAPNTQADLLFKPVNPLCYQIQIKVMGQPFTVLVQRPDLLAALEGML